MEHLIASFRQSGQLHHAYALVGGLSAKEALLVFFANAGIATHGNPDFWHGTFDTFTIDDSRRLAAAQNNRDFGSARKIFLIEANIITEEAQNSLLKIFEEPTEGTHFFIVIPQDMLLPTLRSRVQVLVHQHTDAPQESVVSRSLAERMALVKELVDDISDEDKTKQDAIALVNHIEAELYTRGTVVARRELSACQDARASLYDRGAPVKMILEQLMLVI